MKGLTEQTIDQTLRTLSITEAQDDSGEQIFADLHQLLDEERLMDGFSLNFGPDKQAFSRFVDVLGLNQVLSSASRTNSPLSLHRAEASIGRSISKSSIDVIRLSQQLDDGVGAAALLESMQMALWITDPRGDGRVIFPDRGEVVTDLLLAETQENPEGPHRSPVVQIGGQGIMLKLVTGTQDEVVTETDGITTIESLYRNRFMHNRNTTGVVSAVANEVGADPGKFWLDAAPLYEVTFGSIERRHFHHDRLDVRAGNHFAVEDGRVIDARQYS